jgi:hypothetical protein
MRACGVAARRSWLPKERPPTPRVVFMLSIVVLVAQVSFAPGQVPSNVQLTYFACELLASDVFKAWTLQNERKLFAVFEHSVFARRECDGSGIGPVKSLAVHWLRCVQAGTCRMVGKGLAHLTGGQRLYCSGSGADITFRSVLNHTALGQPMQAVVQRSLHVIAKALTTDSCWRLAGQLSISPTGTFRGHALFQV